MNLRHLCLLRNARSRRYELKGVSSSSLSLSFLMLEMELHYKLYLTELPSYIVNSICKVTSMGQAQSIAQKTLAGLTH